MVRVIMSDAARTFENSTRHLLSRHQNINHSRNEDENNIGKVLANVTKITNMLKQMTHCECAK